MAESGRRNSKRYVLDANALIGLLENRRGTVEKVRHLLEQAVRNDTDLLMSAVNWGEVFYIAWRRHGEAKAREAEAKLQEIALTVIGVDRDRASRAGALKQKYGLGYADAFAAELAIDYGAWLVTADPEFAKMGKALALYPLTHERPSH